MSRKADPSGLSLPRQLILDEGQDLNEFYLNFPTP
jgi:hypothetical protein